MSKKFEKTSVAACKKMTLELKETRSSSVCHSYKEGYEEVSHDTKTRFHWRLNGMASKLGPEVVSSDEFDPSEQEIYTLTISSHGFDIGLMSGFKTREKAICNALEFAERNGIEVDGYKARKAVPTVVP